MLLILDAELSDPPSSRTCFRDVTLYASIFTNADILVECEDETLDVYWKWLKGGGAMDFVDQLIRLGEVRGFSIRRNKRANVRLDRLDEVSLSTVVSVLKTKA